MRSEDERVPYKTRLEPLVRRQLVRWNLSEDLLVDVHLRLNDDLSTIPVSILRKESTWFGGEGMVYGFDLVDRNNRMLVHAFRFQVFYHSDEQTLLVARGAHVTFEGM